MLDGWNAVVLFGDFEIGQECDLLAKRLSRRIPVELGVTNLQIFIQIVLDDQMARQEVTEGFVVDSFDPLPCHLTVGDFGNARWESVLCHEF